MSSRSHAALGRRFVRAAVLAVALAGLPRPAAAQVQVGPTILTEYGFGGLLRVGAGPFHVEGGAGFVPIWVMVDVTGGDDIFRIYLPRVVGGKASYRVSSSPVTDIEVELGAAYNSLIRFGVGGGVNVRPKNIRRILLSAGAMIYPDAGERLRLQINADEGTNFTPDTFEMPLAEFQIYAGLAILFGR